ncbi:MAG TPA: hypothetical protein VGN17_24490 [Bryobacteraceae bacterium]|jgi:hypothetical protein
MRKFIFASGAAATLLSMVLLAADIDGKWVLESQGQNGKQTQTLTLKADGGKLTGSMDNQGTAVDGKVNISDGTIDGSKVAFTVVRELNGAPITRKFSGTMAGSDLKLTVETAGGPGAGKGGGQEMVFKKQ